MKKYINKRIYTDVESYLVTEIDEVKGTAMAVEVEKRIKPKMIPGGFAGHCPDLNREFAEAEPVIRKGANPSRSSATRMVSGVSIARYVTFTAFPALLKKENSSYSLPVGKSKVSFS